MTSAEGSRRWAEELAAEGRYEMAVEAMRTAATLDPLNANRQFDHANLLIRLAGTQSPYFRDQTWAQAKRVVERGQQLAPSSEVGPELYEYILRAELADAETTKDATPMRLLPRGSTDPGLEVRPIRETTAVSARPAELAWLLLFVRMGGGLMIGLLYFVGRALTSGFRSAVSPVEIAVIVAVWGLYAFVVGRILGPRLEERRNRVEF